MKKIYFNLVLALSTALWPVALKAESASAGLSLLETHARPFALGEAYTAIQDDATGLLYNPASLMSLNSAQAAFSYQKGMTEDTRGQLVFGRPAEKISWGLSVEYYDGGDFEIQDGVNAARSASTQRDLAAGLGTAFNLGRLDLGLRARYIQSELAESYKASAYAADAGLSVPMTQQLRFGAAVQNIGTPLKYVDTENKLPSLARAGFSYGFTPGRARALVLVDAVYRMNEQELTPAAGLEVGWGPIALRAGYKSGDGLDKFSVGTGIALGRMSVDYGIGLLSELNTEHHLSLTMRLGADKNSLEQAQAVPQRAVQETVVLAPENPAPLPVVSALNAQPKASSKARRYTVRRGDTLSRIAERYYGDKKMWKLIYAANKQTLKNAVEIEVGQKILLP